jgi:hypothetical protein
MNTIKKFCFYNLEKKCSSFIFEFRRINKQVILKAQILSNLIQTFLYFGNYYIENRIFFCDFFLTFVQYHVFPKLFPSNWKYIQVEKNTTVFC